MENNCKICDDSGYVRGKDLDWWDEGFGKLEPCECRRKEIEERKSKESQKKKPDQVKMDLRLKEKYHGYR